MYYIYGISGPSLLIESTDSMIDRMVGWDLYMHLTPGSLNFAHSACLNTCSSKGSLEIVTSNLRTQACCSCIHMQLIIVPLAATCIA